MYLYLTYFSKLNKTLLLSSLFLCLFYLKSQPITSVYVSAHPDDWQLFMNPNAYLDIKKSNKVIFIHMTAGDVGLGQQNLFLAREEGSLRAIRFLSNIANDGNIMGSYIEDTRVMFNGHQLIRKPYYNTVSYFLRLPDGNLDGTGFPKNHFFSLEKFYKKNIPYLKSIDGNNTYFGLGDLQKTLEKIIAFESEKTKEVIINIPDDSCVYNPGDHSDHIYSSKLFQSIDINKAQYRLYQGYVTGAKKQNINNKEHAINVGTWGATSSGMSDNFSPAIWDKNHNRYLNKQYYRKIKYSQITHRVASCFD